MPFTWKRTRSSSEGSPLAQGGVDQFHHLGAVVLLQSPGGHRRASNADAAGHEGLWSSKGTMFLFTVMCASPRIRSASLPVTSLLRRSSRKQWLSVPPLTTW